MFSAVIMVAAFLVLSPSCQKVTPIPAKTTAGTTKTTTGIIIHFYEEWLQAASLPWRIRTAAVGFAIGSKGYIGGGVYDDPYWGEQYLQDFWQYDPSSNTWVQKASIPVPMWGAASFVIGTQAYVCTGASSGGQLSSLYRYDQASDTWTRLADFPGGARNSAVGISIGQEGYVGTGYSYAVGYTSDWWRYDPPSNQWFQEANVPGGGRTQASGFSAGGFGHITCGIGNSGFKNDTWEYWPGSNLWIQVASLPAVARYGAIGFNYGQYGAVTCGLSSSYTSLNDFWYYNPNSNVWTQDIKFGGGARAGGVGFTINGIPYVGTGYLYTAGEPQYNDLWYETLVFY